MSDQILDKGRRKFIGASLAAVPELRLSAADCWHRPRRRYIQKAPARERNQW